MSHAIGRSRVCRRRCNRQLNDREIKPVKQPYAATFGCTSCPMEWLPTECDPRKRLMSSTRRVRKDGVWKLPRRCSTEGARARAMRSRWCGRTAYWKVVSEVEPEAAERCPIRGEARRWRRRRPLKAKLGRPRGGESVARFSAYLAGIRQLRRRSGYVSPRSMPAWCGIWRRQKPRLTKNIKLRFAGR